MSNWGSLNLRIYSGAWWGDVLCAHAHSNDVSAEPHITTGRVVSGVKLISLLTSCNLYWLEGRSKESVVSGSKKHGIQC